MQFDKSPESSAGMNDQQAGIDQSSSEWDAARAIEEWPDQRGIWAPLSWRDHLHEFNVFHDGTLVASSYGGYGFSRRSDPQDQALGFSLRVKFFEATDHAPSPETISGEVRRYRNPDGMNRSRWANSTVPQLIVEHSLPAVLVEQRQFAHLPGGTAAARGDEPLFLWVRFQVTEILEIVNDMERIACALTPLSDHMTCCMNAYNNILQFNKPPFYPLPLDYEGDAGLTGHGRMRNQHLQFGRRNRLALPAQPGRELEARWHPLKEYIQDNLLYAKKGADFEHLVITLPCRVGACLDLLVPFCQVDDATLDAELAIALTARSKKQIASGRNSFAPIPVWIVPNHLCGGTWSILFPSAS